MKTRGHSTVHPIAGAVFAAGLALLAVPAHAAKCVKPGGGGGCFATIQEAVDAAVAGETIFVRPGKYPSAVDVPAGKDGLSIVGTGKTPGAVRLSPENAGDLGIGIQSANVTVRNLTVSGATYGVASAGGKTKVSRVRILAIRGACIALAGDGNAVLSSRIKGCESLGIGINGSDALVRGVTVAQSLGIGIVGARTRVISSRILNSTGYGIQIAGDSALVRYCRVQESGAGAIYVSGNSTPAAPARVVRNRVSDTGGVGIAIIGDGPKVLAGNLALAADNSALGLSCSASCDADRVTGNVARGMKVGFSAFQVLAAAPGGVVAGNLAADATPAGFVITAPAAEIRDNASVNCGAFPSAPGFLIIGDGSTVSRNVARGSLGAGFRVGGVSVTLKGNRAVGNGRHGFSVGQDNPASGTVLDGNRATGNVDYGFYLGSTATGVTVTSNVAHGNSHAPFCDESGGGPAVFSGNSFPDSDCLH